MKTLKGENKMKTIEKYIKETYDHDELENIVNNGCVSGAAGCHIYYVDTVAFYQEFDNQIWDMVYDASQDQGISSLEFIASLNGNKDVGCMEQLENLLCWYAIEETACSILNNQTKGE